MSGRLSEHQLETFDTEYVNDARWQVVAPLIATSFGDRPFRVIDVGGGNGAFADRVLSAFTSAEVVVLEPAPTLLDRNVPHPRKSCVEAGIEGLAQHGEADLITINWVLHHLVARTYRGSGAAAVDAMRLVRSSLGGPESRASVFEIDYDGWPLASLPGRVTFMATRSRLLRRAVRRAGSNTAGVGVCFRSHEQWRELFERTGFQVETATETAARAPGIFEHSAIARRLLTLSSYRTGHYWLVPGK